MAGDFCNVLCLNTDSLSAITGGHDFADMLHFKPGFLQSLVQRFPGAFRDFDSGGNGRKRDNVLFVIDNDGIC